MASNYNFTTPITFSVSTPQSPSVTPTPTPGRGRPRGSVTGTGAKRGRKPKNAITTNSPRINATTVSEQNSATSSPVFSSPQFSHVHWAVNSTTTNDETSVLQGGISNRGTTGSAGGNPGQTASQEPNVDGATDLSAVDGTPGLVTGLAGGTGTVLPPTGVRPIGIEEDGDVDDEWLPAMADDDYSAQQSWNTQSKDNLKILMDNFTPAQYDRFEAYRRHALPKQAVRKVIQQTCGQQVSQPVAQIIAGISKVFVGEIIEKARAVQVRRGETGPLSPDHLREAYRMYQQETGRVGAARPLRSKRLFVR